jgi:hypothetical protein
LCMAFGKDFDTEVELQEHIQTEHGVWST